MSVWEYSCTAWAASHPSSFTDGERAYDAHQIGGWWTVEPVRKLWNREKSLVCARNQTPAIQSIAHHYTKWAISSCWNIMCRNHRSHQHIKFHEDPETDWCNTECNGLLAYVIHTVYSPHKWSCFQGNTPSKLTRFLYEDSLQVPCTVIKGEWHYFLQIHEYLSISGNWGNMGHYTTQCVNSNDFKSATRAIHQPVLCWFPPVHELNWMRADMSSNLTSFRIMMGHWCSMKRQYHFIVRTASRQ
jgi:hypothetical protein